MTGRFVSSVALLAFGAGAAAAQATSTDTVGILGQFGRTGTGPEAFRPVEQQGDYAWQLEAQDYRGGVFSAQHGSWNRTVPIGARVMFTPVDAEGQAGEPNPFAEGWLMPSGEYIGRPVDVAKLPDGSILVSDDLAGAVYRISYQSP